MAWGQEKGADVKISALRACQYEIFDFVPCSLPLKILILLTFSCFLIRRRGKLLLFLYILFLCIFSIVAVISSRRNVIFLCAFERYIFRNIRYFHSIFRILLNICQIKL